jgi:glycosyltransferase involved in cell wall biosynthesis
MKIALCAPCGIAKDGIADYSRYLADGLRKAGCAVRIVPLGYYIGDNGYYRKAAEEANKADICHVQFNYVYFNGELPYRNRFLYFARHVRVPIIITAHEVRIGMKPLTSGFKSTVSRAAYNILLPLLDRWSIAFHKKAFRSAARIIVHTEEHLSAVRSLETQDDKAVLIPHGIPEIKNDDKRMPATEAKKLLRLEGKKVLTIPGFINKRKGYETALGMLGGLPDDVILLIAGGMMTGNATDREYFRMLEIAIGEKGLAGRVRITGYLKEKEIPVVMAATDICLAPFSSSAASGALGLCIGYNKPIIASDIPVHREINARVPCLELFKGGDPAALLGKIKDLFSDKDRIKRLSGSSDSYGEQYSYSKVAEATVAIYKDATGKDAEKK